MQASRPRQSSPSIFEKKNRASEPCGRVSDLLRAYIATSNIKEAIFLFTYFFSVPRLTNSV
jgi:hypothetical protein